MPLEFGIWRVDEQTTKLEPSRLAQEAHLEKAIENDIGLIDSNLLLIGRQVATDYGKKIDLLAINTDGDLVVIEIKRDRTPREIVAQTLDYASWILRLSYDEITEIHGAYVQHRGLPPTPFEEAFEEAFGTNPPDTLNEKHKLLIVASELDDATERIISYLANPYGVPINVAFFRYFHDAGRDYLARAWLIDPSEMDSGREGSTAKARQPWNGQDFYAAFGVSETRAWKDAQRYGFISAGGGKWYIQTLSQLTRGKRVFVHIPGEGYVGVGEVLEAVQPLEEFHVDVNGARVPILEAPHEAPQIDKFAGDPERVEHFVRVKWIATRPRDGAIWKKGFFANQNTVCKLRNRYTLETLVEQFGLDE